MAVIDHRRSFRRQLGGKSQVSTVDTRDIIDRMHCKATQGTALRTMIERFPEVSPDDLEYWMRTNGYIRNG